MATFSKRLGVGDPQGSRSSEWVVMWKSDKGDVYLAGRTLGQSFRVSLHESGVCFIRAPDPNKWTSPGPPPRSTYRWTINPHSQFEFPFGIVIPTSELRSGEWAKHRDKGTIWIPAATTRERAIEIAVFLTRAEPRPINQLSAAGWKNIIVLERLPDGRDLWVVAGETEGFPIDKRAELEQIKIQAKLLNSKLTCQPVNPRLLLCAIEAKGTRRFVEAAA